MKYIIYMHKLKIDGRTYIGATCQNPKKRWQRGLGYAHSKRFKEAIDKYGWDNFEHIILFENLTKEEAEQKEIEMIKKYKSNNIKYGFNIYEGGFHSPITEVQKEIISKTHKNKIVSKETIEKINATKRRRYKEIGLTEKEKERYKKRIKLIRCIETNIIYQGQKDLKNNGFNPSNVFMVCNSIRKTASGFHWEYV